MQSVANMVNRNGNGAGRAACSSARKDRVLLRFISHSYDLMIWPKRATIASLQRRHNVSRRTLLRDFAKLRENGIPIKFDQQEGCYYLPHSFLNPSESHDVLATVENKPHEEGGSLHSEWPLRWSETVALFAVLEGAESAPGSELQSLVRRARDRLTDWVETALRDKAGSVFSNAKLLVKKPTLSISELQDVMERFWSRKEAPANGVVTHPEAAPLDPSRLSPIAEWQKKLELKAAPA